MARRVYTRMWFSRGLGLGPVRSCLTWHAHIDTHAYALLHKHIQAHNISYHMVWGKRRHISEFPDTAVANPRALDDYVIHVYRNWRAMRLLPEEHDSTFQQT